MRYRCTQPRRRYSPAKNSSTWRFELGALFRSRQLAVQAAQQDRIQRRFIGLAKHHHVQRMIGHFATVSGEVIHALVPGRRYSASEAADGGVRRRLQLPQIVVEAGTHR